MDYEVIPDRRTPDVWRVEWTVDEDEGTFCAVIFSGPGSKALAEEYAAWKSETAERQIPALSNQHGLTTAGCTG